jgi:hypothetical protein
VSSRFLLRYVLPAAAVLTSLFGAYYLVWGAIALQRGNVGFGVFYGVYGIGGLVLGLALGRVWRQWRRPPA